MIGREVPGRSELPGEVSRVPEVEDRTGQCCGQELID